MQIENGSGEGRIEIYSYQHSTSLCTAYILYINFEKFELKNIHRPQIRQCIHISVSEVVTLVEWCAWKLLVFRLDGSLAAFD